MKVIVYHRYFGCDTGCCGHAIKIDGKYIDDSFGFTHPYGIENDLELRSWAYMFAKEQLNDIYGKEHAFDLDWENCDIVDD